MLPNCPFPWGVRVATEYVVAWAHPSPRPKRHLDWFSCFSAYDVTYKWARDNMRGFVRGGVLTTGDET